MSSDAKQIEAVITFADITGSTGLYERFGDQRASEAIAECIGIMSEATTHYRGFVVKTMGDEVMSAFRNPDNAVAALVRMQEEITDKRSLEGIPLRIRSALHFGTVLFNGSDFFGDAVNTAARVVAQAKPGQILTTGDTFDRLSAEWQAAMRRIDETTVRGKRDPIALFDLVRRKEEATVVMAAPGLVVREQAKLVLRLGGEQIVIDIAKAGATLGRGDGNDLVVRNELVSRLHARIEWRRGRFVLVDQSVNGTFVAGNGEASAWIRRDEHTLDGHGVIGLGREVTADDPEAIAYTAGS
jgi:adenylate cyclase